MKVSFFEFIRRDLILGIVLSALVFGCALALGGPFLATNRSAAPVAAPAAQPAPQATTLRGTVTRNGGHVYLNDGVGNVYQLDNVHHSRALEGQYVAVTGELYSQARLMYVERIVPITA